MLELKDFKIIDNIYFPEGSVPTYKIATECWDERADVWVKTGYGSQKPGGLWKRFPHDLHFSTIVDLGCGYGRHIIYLAQKHQLTCDRYYGIDISETMLRRLLAYKQDSNFFDTAEMFIICMPLGKLPIPNESVDLVCASSVFLHLSKKDTELTLAEVYRILKPGGSFIFENNFFNRQSISYKLGNVLRSIFLRGFKPNYWGRYSLDEIRAMIEASRLPEKVSASSYNIVPSYYEAIPRPMRKIIPGGNLLNSYLMRSQSSEAKMQYFASAYSVYSSRFLIGKQD